MHHVSNEKVQQVRLNMKFKSEHEVHLQKARQRIGGILMQWHCRLGLSPASNQEFGKYLEKLMQVTLYASLDSAESAPAASTPAASARPLRVGVDIIVL